MQRFGSTKKTPQKEPVPGKKQVKNLAGGFVFEASCWTALDRFLIIGTEGGTYYAGKEVLDKENINSLLACIKEDHKRVVDRTVEVSDKGLALRNDPALFSLALCASQGSVEGKLYALEKLDNVARIGTHLFHFVEYLREHRGMGRAVHRALAKWYTEKEINRLAYQLVKYQRRDGWSHKDILRLVRPGVGEPAEVAISALFRWAVEKPMDEKTGALLPPIVKGYELAKKVDKKDLPQLVREYGLTREMIPTEALTSVPVWEALLEKMPLLAIIRNLGNMSSVGLLKPMSKAETKICERLVDQDYVLKSRVHPMAVLIAMHVYALNRGVKGSSTWKSTSNVIDALNKCFELSFGNVEPAGKRHLIGLDVSGSMHFSGLLGVNGLSPAVASIAMCKILAMEPSMAVMAFSDKFVPLNLGWKTEPMSALVRSAYGMGFGGTDCALPMIYAMNEKIDVDTFVVLTDHETWAGSVHPFQALQHYRQTTGINARLAVCAFTPSAHTVADPNDKGMMDFVGLDASLPRVVNSFSKGEI